MKPEPDILKMPRSTFAFYCVVFSTGLCTSVYVIWWLNHPFVAFFAWASALCILLPIFARREFSYVHDLEHEYELDKQAQRIASDAYIERRLKDSEERLFAMRADDQRRIGYLHQENSTLMIENMRLHLEKNDLERKYLPFSPAQRRLAALRRKRDHGKFVSGTMQIAGPKNPTSTDGRKA